MLSDVDNSAVDVQAVRRMGGCETGGAPQLTALAEIAWFGPKGWGCRASAGYAGRRYVEPMPLRRTDRIAGQGGITREFFDAFTRQERLPDAFTLDAALFKSFRFERSRLTASLMLRNLTGEADTVYGGYESLRVRRIRPGLGSGVHAQKRSLPALARKQADSLARKQVIYNDRVVPFNTLARDFVLKLTGKSSYGGMTPEQVIGGWLLRPEVWQNEPMIYIKNEALRRLLHLETPYACLADLFDGEKYRLQKFWKGKQDHHQKMTSLEKAIVEADEKVGLILMLQNGTLIRPLPEDGSVEPVSDTKIQAELLYNRIPFSKLLFMFNLTVGMLAFFRLLYRGLRRSSALSDSSGRIVALSFSSRLADTFFPFSLYAAFLFQLFGYGLRWYIGGRIPLGNGYETMQFMALCALFLACLFRRRFPFMVPFGFLLSGFALLVSYLGQMNPQITPLMPVLVSPWLSTHVSLIMMSYALFAFMMLNGILALCLRRSARMLMLLSRLLLYPAVFFLGAGIFLGAVWANASWGRYWAWDPKEVWALITFMVYGAAFHARSLRIFRSPLFFHIYMIVAFLTVLMTYFGVNYILGGMHSYANA